MAKLSGYFPGILTGFSASLQDQLAKRQDEAQKLRLLEAEYKLRNQYDPEAQLKTEIFRQVLQGGQGIQGTSSNSMQSEIFRHLLGLGPSTTEMTQEAQAKKTGELAAEASDPLEQQKRTLETGKSQVEEITKIQALLQDPGIVGRLMGKKPLDPQVGEFLKSRLQSLADPTTPTPESSAAPVQFPNPEDLVRVINPSGQPTRIHKQDLPAALKSGYRRR